MNNKYGFTLMEILLVIAISLLLLGTTLSVFFSFSKSRAIDVASERIIDTLRIARSHTLASKDESTYGVHFASSTITLFKGSSFSSVDPNNIVYTFPRFVELSVIDLVGGGNDVIFQRLTGETDEFGTTTLQLISDPTTTATVFIRNTGLSE